MGGDITAHDGTSADHCAFTDSHVRQNDAMRTNEDVFFDHDLAVAPCSSWAPIKMSENGCSETNCAVVADGYFSRMQFIQIYELCDPNIRANTCAAQSM
jgi:hypothetical protein